MSRVSVLVDPTPVQSKPMTVRRVGGVIVPEHTLFQADLAASRAFLVVNTTLVRSKPMTVFSAGGTIVMDKALFPLD